MRDFRIKRNNRLYQILGILLLCISLISLVSEITLSWFRDQSVTSNGDADITIIGTLDLDVTTNFNFYNLALAPDRIYTTDNQGQAIGTYLKTSNDHDINGAYVRIKFETTRRNVGDSEFRDNKDLLDLYFDGNLTTSTSYTASERDNWYYHTDGYYYYIGAVTNSNVTFNVGYKTSNKMTNVERNAEVRIDYTVETIQRQYDAYINMWTSAPAIFTGWAVKDKEARWDQPKITN